MTIAATAAMLAAVVVWHPAEQLDPVRRAVGLGPERPLPAPSVVRQGGTFTWAMTQPDSDEPVGWDPCEEVRYRINPAGEPPGGSELPRVMEGIVHHSNTGQVELGPGDREGLARLGSLPCR